MIAARAALAATPEPEGLDVDVELLHELIYGACRLNERLNQELRGRQDFIDTLTDCMARYARLATGEEEDLTPHQAGDIVSDYDTQEEERPTRTDGGSTAIR
jgi:hypothetical protein